jgi:hypothetical protein
MAVPGQLDQVSACTGIGGIMPMGWKTKNRGKLNSEITWWRHIL